MSSSPTPRKRAVRLTTDAHEALVRALETKWQARGTPERFTRETKAELLGVSVTTVARILVNRPVDRATLAIAFKNVGLSWEDGHCERPIEVPEEAPPQTAAPVPEPPSATEPRPRGRLVFSLAAFMLAFVALGWKAFVPKSEPFPAWMTEFNALEAQGTEKFHHADYPGARIALRRAMDLARMHDSAGRLAAAIHMDGHVQEAAGRLEEARQDYQQALDLRLKLNQASELGPLGELLGDVETRLGLYEKARLHLSGSLKAYTATGNPVGIALASRNLGSLAYRQGELDDADRWFDRSLEAIKGQTQPSIVMDVRGRRALVLLARGRANEARELQQECLAHWRKENHPRWIASCELQLGLTEIKLGNPDVASSLIRRSRTAYMRLDDRDGLRRSDAALKCLPTRSL